MNTLEEIFELLHKEMGFEIAVTVFSVLKVFKVTDDFVRDYGTIARDTLKEIQEK